MATKFTTKQKLQELSTTLVQPKQAFGTTKTIDEQWQELYRTACNSQQGAWYVDCRINKGMTPEQAREYVAANWTYKETIVTLEDQHRSRINNRLKTIKAIQTIHGFTPTWAAEIFAEAKLLGISVEGIEPKKEEDLPEEEEKPQEIGASGKPLVDISAIHNKIIF